MGPEFVGARGGGGGGTRRGVHGGTPPPADGGSQAVFPVRVPGFRSGRRVPP
ncbi:hypothetical protein SFR_6122 [Streptomyces sp. FR-008]|nr:hypothetical protein SFR_6122 [Streptomyces sp. FR-008]